jgi:hypothetical protein
MTTLRKSLHRAGSSPVRGLPAVTRRERPSRRTKARARVGRAVKDGSVGALPRYDEPTTTHHRRGLPHLRRPVPAARAQRGVPLDERPLAITDRRHAARARAWRGPAAARAAGAGRGEASNPRQPALALHLWPRGVCGYWAGDPGRRPPARGSNSPCPGLARTLARYTDSIDGDACKEPARHPLAEHALQVCGAARSVGRLG